MSERLLPVSDSFWNIRGEFRIGGLVNIGTHASLVRRANGRFLLLDAYTLNDSLKAEVDALTDGGKAIEAILNLHPFHTVHVERAHRQFPGAKLYGTARHVDKFPELPWQPQHTESAECAALFADDLELSVPAGVDFIPANPNLHFSSVLAYHRESKTLHVDDTLVYAPIPGPLGRLLPPVLAFHPTLALTLEKRAGAAGEFRQWAQQLSQRWEDAANLCAAHSASLLADDNRGEPVAARIAKALKQVDWILRRHERKHG